jgi:hypothetical protein
MRVPGREEPRAEVRHGGARGQALPFFALALPVLLAFTALGVDAASFYLERREAQGVADLAALAGVKSLPSNATKARNDACVVAAANGYTTSNTYPCPGVIVTTPYGGTNTKIEVQVDRSVTTFFMPILSFFAPGDFSSQGISARAVARSEPTTTGDYAVFTLQDSCTATDAYKDIDWSGSGASSSSPTMVNGSVHSSSGVLIGGSNNSVPAPYTFTYECSGKFLESGTNTGIPPKATSPETCPGSLVNTPCLANRDPPVTYDFNSFNTSPNPPCDYPSSIPRNGDFNLADNGTWWVNGSKSSRQLRAGKYCATGSIILGDSDNVVVDVEIVDVGVRKGVTFVANKVSLSGSENVLSAYDRGVLFFANASSDDAIKVEGSGNILSGLIYAPNGTVGTAGSNTRLTGGIVAKRVRFNGSSWNITGTVGASVQGYQQLIE